VKTAVLIVALCGIAFGQATGISVQATPTQVVISYTAPSSAGCPVVVSTSNTLSPLVNDLITDPGGTSDLARASTVLGTGFQRTVVIGKRNAVRSGMNGFSTQYVSNALQTNTTYYGSLTCGSAATFSFQTLNIPLGLGFSDGWPTDPSSPGTWVVPSSPGAIAGEFFTDPTTGIAVQRLTYPGFGYMTGTQTTSAAYNQGQLPSDSAGPWVTPGNATGSSGFASVSNSTAPIVVRPDTISSNWGDGQTCTGDTVGDYSDPSCGPFLQIQQVNVTGYCSDPTPANCVLNVNLSENAGGSAATTFSKQVTLPFGTSSAAAATVTTTAAAAGSTGIDGWLYDTNPKITRADSFQHTGQVTVAGSTVTLASGDYFDATWTAGGSGRIRLSNVSQADACRSSGGSSVEETVTAGFGKTLTTAAAPGSYGYYCAQDYAVMIARAVAQAGTSVFIQGVTVSYVSATPGEWPDAGFQTLCAHTSFSGGTLCEVPVGGGGGQLSWINTATGAVNVVGPLVANASSGSVASQNIWPQSPCPLFSPDQYIDIDDTQTTPTLYCLVPDASSKQALLKVVYTGSYASSNNYAAAAAIGTGAVLSSTAYSVTYANATISDLTPSSLSEDLGTIIAAYLGTPLEVPAAQAPLDCDEGMVMQGNITVFCGVNNGGTIQNTMGWIFQISPGDGNPAHAGTTGAHVVGALNTWQYAASRDGVNHSIQDYGQVSGYVGYGPDPMFPGDGTPGNTAVLATTNTAIPAIGSRPACSTFGSPLGLTTQHCIQLQMNTNGGSYEPYYWESVGLQGTTPGVPSAAQVGDVVCVSETSGCNWLNFSNEYLMLVGKGTGGAWVYRSGPFPSTLNDTNLKYLYWLPSSFSTPDAAAIPGWGGMYAAFPSYIPSPIFGNNVFWNYQADPGGQHSFIDPEGQGGHGSTKVGASYASSVMASTLPYSPYTADYNVRNAATLAALETAPIGLVSADPSFHSILGSAAAELYQSHASASGDNATLYNSQAAFDVRPLVGTGSTAPTPSFTHLTANIWVMTCTSGSGGFTDVDNFCGLNRKVYATAASAGPHPLVDVSGPGSNVAATAYTYCTPRVGGVSGECYPGSNVTGQGQIYVNAPGVVWGWCYTPAQTAGTTVPQANDICVMNASPAGNAGIQFSTLQSDLTASYQRVITAASNGPLKFVSGFANIRTTPDNSWAMFQGNYVDGITRSNYMALLPPFPAPDSYNRSDYIQVPVSLTAPTGLGVTNAIVTFGYLDYQGNCGPRNDACIANAATIPSGTAPFLYASESPAGLACATNCTITVPAISERVLYYTASFRNSSNTVVATMPTVAAAVEPFLSMALSPTMVSGAVSIQGGAQMLNAAAPAPFNILTLTGNSFAPSTALLTGFPTVTGGFPAEGYQGGVFFNNIAYFEPWQYATSIPHGTILAYTGGPSGTFHCTNPTTCAANWKWFDMTTLAPFVPAGYTATGAAATGYTCQGVMDGSGNYYQIPGFDQQNPVMMSINLLGSGGITNSANYSYFSVPDHGSGGGASPIDGGYSGPRGWCTGVFDGQYVYLAPTNGGSSGTNTNLLRYNTTGAGGFVIANFAHYDLAALSGGTLNGGFESSAYDGQQKIYMLPSNGGDMVVYDKTLSFTSTGSYKTLNFSNLGTTSSYPQVTGAGNLNAIQTMTDYIGAQVVWDPTGTIEYLYMGPFGYNPNGSVHGTTKVLSNVIRVKVATCSPGVPGTQSCTGTFTAIDITAHASIWEIFDLANLVTNSAWVTAGFPYPPLYPAGSPLANQLTLGGFQLTWLNVHNTADPIVGFVADYGNFFVRHHASHTLNDPTGWDVGARPAGYINGVMGGGYDPVNQLLYASGPSASPLPSVWQIGPL
jgi:hypothetical protein